jgi:hypothetical protein
MKTLLVGVEEKARDFTLLLLKNSFCRVERPLANFIGEKEVDQRCGV